MDVKTWFDALSADEVIRLAGAAFAVIFFMYCRLLNSNKGGM